MHLVSDMISSILVSHRYPCLHCTSFTLKQDMHQSSSANAMTRHILGWVDELASGRNVQLQQKLGDDHSSELGSWVQWPDRPPPDLMSVNCQLEICVFRKVKE